MQNSPLYVQPEQQASFIQTMLDAAMHGVVLLEPVRDSEQQVSDFIVRAANAAIEKHSGVSAEEATGNLMSQIYPGYKKYHFFDAYVEALQTGQLIRRELFYRDSRGEGWFDLGVAPNENMLVVTFVNITEAKEYQLSIQRYAAQLHTVIDTSQSGMFLFKAIKNEDDETVDFEFTMANRALAGYVGQPPEKLIGERGSKWFPAYKNNGLFQRYRDTYETGRTNRFEFHYDGDDIDVWLDIMSTKFEDEVLVTFTDYTPTKNLQLQLEASVSELSKSNDYLKEFAYAASHDLQEPLRKIRFYSDKMKQQLKTTVVEENFSLLERMDASVDRMRILIDDLLAYSQISADEKNSKPVNLNSVLKEVITDLEAAIKEKAAQFHISDLPVVVGDKRQLHQLFQNLVSNALKYSTPGVVPEINITCGQVAGKHHIPDAPANLDNGPYYLIEVKDNGMGFEQQYARKIFQIFQRLHGRVEYPGTGVGLAIAQKVVENHRGCISAESQPGKGATFRTWLPAERP